MGFVRCMVIFLLFFYSAHVLPCRAEARPLNICGAVKVPFRYQEDGRYTGMDVDIISEILDSMGVEYQINLHESSSRHVHNIELNCCDMAFTYSRTAAREEFLDYPSQPHLNICWNFFIRNEDKDRIRFRTLDDLAGLHVGVTKTYAYSPQFWEAVQNGTFVVDACVRNDRQLIKLMKKRFDVVPLNTIAAIMTIRQQGLEDRVAYLPKPLICKSYYNTFVKSSDHPELERIREGYDEALRRLVRNGTWSRTARKYGLDIPPPEMESPDGPQNSSL